MNVLVIWSVRLSLCDPASAARAAQLVALLSYETCLCKKKKKKTANIGVIVTSCYVKIDPFRKCTSISQVFTVLPLSVTLILLGLLRPCFRYVMSSIAQHVVDWELRFCLNNQEKKKKRSRILRSTHVAVDLHSGACPKHAQYWPYHRKVKRNHSRYQRRAAVSTQNRRITSPAIGHVDSEETLWL